MTVIALCSVLCLPNHLNAQYSRRPPPPYGAFGLEAGDPSSSSWSSYGKVEPAWWNGWGGSEGWSPSWGSSWDWGWLGSNEVSHYSTRVKPKQAVFEAAEALLLGRKKNNQTIRGVVQIYQFVG